MNVYVLTIKKGCCNVCAETEILGVFTKIALVNKYIREHTIYGMIAQFTGYSSDIELEDADHGLVTLTVTKTDLEDDVYDTDTEKCKRMLRTTMNLLANEANEEVSCGCILGNDIVLSEIVQDEPDTIGLKFSSSTVTLFDDGTWTLEE